jgi:hypothetical protein
MASVRMLSTLTLCAMQFGDRNGLNSMSFAQVQQLGSNLTRRKDWPSRAASSSSAARF